MANNSGKKTTRKAKRRASSKKRSAALSEVGNGAEPQVAEEDPAPGAPSSEPREKTLMSAEGGSFLEQVMKVESFRAKVIARLVKKLRRTWPHGPPEGGWPVERQLGEVVPMIQV